MRRFATVILLIGIAFTATACFVEEPGHGWGHHHRMFWHPDHRR